jgi:hypothetical protein
VFKEATCLIQMLMVYKKIEGSLGLGNAEIFQIWRAVLTYDQPKMSSFSVIQGYDFYFSLGLFFVYIGNYRSL